jgi:pimeloyl-ACP methyl ester carboxylesterase
VRRLALGSTASDVRGARYRRIAEWIGLARKKDAVGLYLAFGAAIYPPAVFEKYRGVLVRIGETVTEEELERFIILAEGTKDFFVTDRLVGIRCPVFVIGSRDDAVLGPDAAAEIAGHVPDEPGCQTYIYDGYGHAAFDTAPDYREKLLHFFSDPDAPERRFTCRTADHT